MANVTVEPGKYENLDAALKVFKRKSTRVLEEARLRERRRREGRKITRRARARKKGQPPLRKFHERAED